MRPWIWLVAHGPGVEIVAGPPGGRLVEARVDIVRPDLGGGDPQPAIAQGPQKAQRDQRLAAAGRWRGDDDGLSQPGSPAAGPLYQSRRERQSAAWPTTTMAGVGGSFAATKAPASPSVVEATC